MSEDPPEKRLFTIRNIEAFKTNGGQDRTVYEFEVFAEVPVEGQFRTESFSLAEWDAEPLQNGVQRSLVLRFVDCLEASPKSTGSSKTGFYHGITMPAEFCALATTLLRRRITLGPLLRVDNSALRLPQPSQWRHRALLSGNLRLELLHEGFDHLSRLPAGYHEAFVLACRMYQQALAVIDDKPDLAYLLLVSCVEVFVAKFSPRTQEKDLSADITESLAKCADESAKKKLLNRILELDRGISRNFVSFIQEHISARFWDESPKIEVAQGRVTREELPDLLKRIYNQRSKTLHEAEPFPPNVLSPPEGEAEIDRRTVLIVGPRRWTQAQMIPYARFFERLVQHVLLRFLEKNAPPPVQPNTN